jgi:hypothetical protein
MTSEEATAIASRYLTERQYERIEVVDSFETPVHWAVSFISGDNADEPVVWVTVDKKTGLAMSWADD